MAKKKWQPDENTRYVTYRGKSYVFRGVFGDMGAIRMNGRTEYKPLRLLKKSWY